MEEVACFFDSMYRTTQSGALRNSKRSGAHQSLKSQHNYSPSDLLTKKSSLSVLSSLILCWTKTIGSSLLDWYYVSIYLANWSVSSSCHYLRLPSPSFWCQGFDSATSPNFDNFVWFFSKHLASEKVAPCIAYLCSILLAGLLWSSKRQWLH